MGRWGHSMELAREEEAQCPCCAVEPSRACDNFRRESALRPTKPNRLWSLQSQEPKSAEFLLFQTLPSVEKGGEEYLDWGR
jgi:hypothetical protein